MEFICEVHENMRKETPLSPCRFKCRVCKKKRVHGFTNPDHVSNPFGYLYLAPSVCEKCAVECKICMWCDDKIEDR